MAETPENEADTTSSGMILCCPKCKSRDILLKQSIEGYFWVYLCNNCGYKGKEGKPVGCIDKSKEPTESREE
jgi:hypothetical protein